MTAKRSLLEIFNAERGVVCCVGAGGKKSTLYRLAALHPGRVGMTATAHIEHFPRRLAAQTVVAEAPELLSELRALARTERRLYFARPCDLPGRYLGVPYEDLAEIRHALNFDVCLIKADGARNRIVKAPGPHEPALPPGTTTVIPVASIQCVGRVLDAHVCHRPERFAAITGATVGEPIEAGHLVHLLTHEAGSLQGVGDATVIPLINMVDTPHEEHLAREIASRALAASPCFSRIVLARMRDDAPLVAVIER